MDMFADVIAFHNKFGCARRQLPSLDVDRKTLGLRMSLMQEEIDEINRDLSKGDIGKVADGLVDHLYFVMGTAVTLGIDIRPVWTAVHAANMLKEGGGRRGDGKILKPPGWVHPDIGAILAIQPPIPEVVIPVDPETADANAAPALDAVRSLESSAGEDLSARAESLRVALHDLKKLVDETPGPDPLREPKVSDLATIGDGTLVGSGSEITPATFIGNECRIGAKTRIMPGAIIADQVEIGRGSMVSFGARIGPQCSIGDAVGLMAGASLGARVHVHDFSTIGRGAELRDGCTIGGRSRIGDGATIPGNASVPPQTFVPPGTVYHPPAAASDPAQSPGIPADHPDLTEPKDKSLRFRCGVCGIPWRSHRKSGCSVTPPPDAVFDPPAPGA